MAGPFTVKLQSPKYDKRVFTDAAIVGGAFALNSAAGAAFVAGDAGKNITVKGAGVAGADLVTTIAAFVNPTQVTLTAAASTTVTAARAVLGNNGEEIQLAVSQDSYGGNSLAAILTLFSGDNVVLDFGQLREVIRLTGFLTVQGAVVAGYDNPVHWRDTIRRVRSVWPLEDPGLGLNWDSGSLAVNEKDAATARVIGRARLIFDVKWDASAQAFVNFFLYGTVADFSFPNRNAASARTRIPAGVTFFVGRVVTGV